MKRRLLMWSGGAFAIFSRLTLVINRALNQQKPRISRRFNTHAVRFPDAEAVAGACFLAGHGHAAADDEEKQETTLASCFGDARRNRRETKRLGGRSSRGLVSLIFECISVVE